MKTKRRIASTKKSRNKHSSYSWEHLHDHERPIRWLPIDSRVFTPIFHFGSVKGVSRLFLELEITFALLVVMGTFIVAAIRIYTLLFR